MQETDAAQWHRFMEEPARYAPPAALRDVFEGELSEPTCARLLAMERLQPRLSRLIKAGLPGGSDGDGVAEIDRRIALSDAAALETIALRAGAILCANSLAGTIAGPRASALHEALDRETIMIALANRALSDADADLAETGDIHAYVLARGMAVLAGWSRRLPDAVVARIALKFPRLNDAEPAEDGPLAELIEKAAA